MCKSVNQSKERQGWFKCSKKYKPKRGETEKCKPKLGGTGVVQEMTLAGTLERDIRNVYNSNIKSS